MVLGLAEVLELLPQVYLVAWFLRRLLLYDFIDHASLTQLVEPELAYLLEDRGDLLGLVGHLPFGVERVSLVLVSRGSIVNARRCCIAIVVSRGLTAFSLLPSLEEPQFFRYLTRCGIRREFNLEIGWRLFAMICDNVLADSAERSTLNLRIRLISILYNIVHAMLVSTNQLFLRLIP